MSAPMIVVKHPVLQRAEHILAACRGRKGFPGQPSLEPAERWAFDWIFVSPGRMRQVAATIRQLAALQDDAQAAVVADALDADAAEVERNRPIA